MPGPAFFAYSKRWGIDMADVHQSHAERAQWYMWGVDIVLFSSSISYALAPLSWTSLGSSSFRNFLNV
jgi:hypothetical protein